MMTEGRRKPAAFMSYSHADVEVERLTEFRKRLSQEVGKQIGEQFPIFQDEESVQWGENWQERIEESLDEATFFIPIITPGFFKSRNCRDELERFLDRERELNRRDLVLPIYYVDYPLLNDKSRRSSDTLVFVIATRHHADWRDLKHEPVTSPRVKEAMAQLAAHIRDALQRVQDTATSSPRPSAKIEPPTRIVEPYQTNDAHHTTITEAIEAADPRDRILVRPGFYQESLIVDKPLEIIGEGDVHEIEVQAIGKSALVFKAPFGHVANLTLAALPGAQKTSEGYWEESEEYGVDIVHGRLELEGCDISSRSASCVSIRYPANPRLRRNTIHDGARHGVKAHERGGHGTLEDNDIFDNDSDGVEIQEDSNLILRRNTIHDNGLDGVSVVWSRATVEDNDIVDNHHSGVSIAGSTSVALVRRNRINRNGRYGVYAHSGRATIEDNDLRDNAERPGLEIVNWRGWDLEDRPSISVTAKRNIF